MHAEVCHMNQQDEDSARMEENAMPPPAQPSPQPPRMLEPPYDDDVPRHWRRGGRWNRATDPRRKSGVLAVLLSFMPGLGQVYVGNYGRGFTHGLIFVGLVTILASDPGPLTPAFGIGLAFFWFYNVIDAGRRATLYNQLLDAQATGELPSDISLPGARGSMAGGATLVVIGVLLLMYTRFDFDMYWIEEWWPAGLIVLGVWLFFKDRRSRQEERDS